MAMWSCVVSLYYHQIKVLHHIKDQHWDEKTGRKHNEEFIEFWCVTKQFQSIWPSSVVCYKIESIKENETYENKYEYRNKY